MCQKNKAILAAVTSAEVISRFMTPTLAPIALELLSTFNVDISDELGAELIAEDSKGKSKVRGLLAVLDGDSTATMATAVVTILPHTTTAGGSPFRRDTAYFYGSERETTEHIPTRAQSGS